MQERVLPSSHKMFHLIGIGHGDQIVCYGDDGQQEQYEDEEGYKRSSCLHIKAWIGGSRPVDDQKEREDTPEKIEKKLHAKSV